MILIEENFENIITESSKSEGKTFLAGCFMDYGVKNRNGRSYNESDMRNVVNMINEQASQGTHILSELDHPSVLEVKLKNVSHRLMEAKIDGNQVWCKAEVLRKHPNGAILGALIDEGVRVGMSSRGSGQVNENTGEVKDYRFVCCDAVATPSCRSAYPETIQEQLEFYKKGGVITDLAEAQIHDPVAQMYFQIEMRKFINETFNR
jgi:hypothetical protein